MLLTYYSFTNHIYLLYKYKKDLALSNQQGLIYYKTKSMNQEYKYFPHIRMT